MAPSTNTGYTVSLLPLFADTVTLVAFDAVPVKSPLNVVAVSVPVTVTPPDLVASFSLP